MSISVDNELDRNYFYQVRNQYHGTFDFWSIIFDFVVDLVLLLVLVLAPHHLSSFILHRSFQFQIHHHHIDFQKEDVTHLPCHHAQQRRVYFKQYLHM